MTSDIQHSAPRRHPSWRTVGWSIPVFLLCLPLVAGAPWTLSDYIVMGAMFAIAGLGIELAVRMSGDLVYRAAATLAVITAFLLLWVNMAVGFLGSEDNPANLIFFGIIAIALAGAFLVGFRVRGMARTMVATALCQVAAGAIGLAAGWASPGSAGVYEVVMGTGLFTGLWLASAWLFRRSAQRQERAALS